MANINFGIGFNVDKTGIDQIRRELVGIKKMIDESTGEKGLSKDLKDARGQAELLEKALNKATNNGLEKINVKKFNDELKKSGTSLEKVNAHLKDAGVDGSHAIKKLNRELNDTGVKAKEANKLLDSMFDTMGKTVKWGIASSVMNNVTGSIQRAVGFTKALDESLNNIRVVTGKSSAEMKVFSKEANEAAKALGKSTTEYTDASLLYFQQGKNAEQVKELTKATMMAANITGTDVTAMADMITSALNGYSMAADKAIHVTDVLAAVGAATGSNFEELATGMSKVASQAATVGVPFEKLNAMLATITETTREAPETIGTSLKTVFARMSEIKTKGSIDDEDGISMSFGKVKDTLDLVGVALTDETGAMRDMGTVIEEIGGKWESFDTITKSAVTNALAGQRQASRLMALFNQWDRYEVALNEAMNASGTTMEQNETRMDSISYKTQQMRAEMEKLWMKALNSDAFKGTIDAFTTILEKVNELTESFGGMSTLLTTVGGVIVTVFGKQLTGALTKAVDNVSTGIGNIKKKVGLEKDDPTKPDSLKQQRKKEMAVREGLTDDQFKDYKEKSNKNQDLQLEIKSNKELLKLQEDKARNARELLEIGNQIKSGMELETEQKFAARKNVAEREALKLKEEQLKTGKSYAEMTDKLSSKQLAALGQTRQSIQEIKSLEELVRSIQGASEEDGFFKETEEDLKELEKIESELEEINEELETAEKHKENIKKKQAPLVQQENVQSSELKAIEAEAEANRKRQTRMKMIGMAATGIAMAIPLMKTLGDETKTASEKFDAGANAVMGFSSSLLMSGNPTAMVIGGIGLLAGAITKIIVKFNDYNKAVRANEAAIEQYKERTSALNDDIKTLEGQQKSYAEAQRQVALVGGDISKLTDEQRESYRELANQIAETTPEMVAYYDSEGNAIIKANASLDSYIEKKKEALELEQVKMVNNKDNFVMQYSKDYQQNEGQLYREEKKADTLRGEIAKSDNAKEIKEKQEELDKTLGKIAELKTSIGELDKNIQENIINPFMLSNKEIRSVNDSVKQVAASTYGLEDVKKSLKENQYEYKMVGKELVKVKKSYQDVARDVSKDLDELQEQAKNTSTALNRIQRKTGEQGETTQYYNDLWNKITKLDQTTQAYIGTLTKFATSADEAEMAIMQLAGSVNEFGIIAQLPDMKDLIESPVRAAKEEVNELNNDLVALQAKSKDLQARKDAIRTNPNVSNTEAIEQKGNLQVQINNAEKEEMEILDKINEKSAEIAEKQREAIQNQNEQNRLHQQYLMQIAQTPEGMNKIIDSYNAQYEKVKGMMDLMSNHEQQTVTVEGEMKEDGTRGESQDVTVDHYKDSELADSMQDLDEYMNVRDELEGRIAEFKKDSREDTQSALEEMIQQSKEMAESSGEIYEQVANNLQNVSKDVLKEYGKMDKDISKHIDNIIAGSKDAADIEPVVKSIQKQSKALGKMYAVINKDSTAYYADFRANNAEQMKLVGLATGVMGDDYATYAQYTADLDQWMADNSSWLSDEQASGYYWAAMQGINAKAEHARETGKIGDQEVTAAEIDAQAKLDAQKAAAAASIIAEGNAFIEKNNIIISSLNAITSATDGEISRAAVRAAKKKIKEIKTQTELAQNIVNNAMNQLNDLAGGGDGNTTDTTKPPPPPPVNKDGWEYNPGGGNVERVPTTKPGGPPPPSNLGGGDKGGDKGGKEDKEKEVEDMEWEEDKYHDINNELERKSKLLDKLKNQQDKLYGKALFDNLTKQKNLLEQQQKLLERKLEMQKQDAKAQADALRAQGVVINTSTGMIENYNEIIAARVAAANALSGEAKEQAIKSAEEFIAAMEAYEELVNNGIFETQNSIQESIDAQREIYMEQFTFEINVKLELSEDLQEALEFQKDMNDKFEDTSENLELTQKQILDAMQILGDLEEQYNNTMNDASLSDKERITALETLSDQIKEAVKNLKDLNEQMVKIFTDGLKKGLDNVKEHLDAYKDINKEFTHMEQMLNLLGKKDDFGMLDQIYKGQYDTIMGQIDTLLASKEKLEKARKELEDAGMVGTEQWKEVDEAIKKTTEDINKLTQDAVKNLQQQFKNSVNEIMADLEKSMTGGTSFDAIKKKRKEQKDHDKKYLDSQEKLLAVTKLQSKVQKEIDATEDPAKKAKLKKFMDDEVKRLKEKDNLTKYDVDRANKMYEIAQKQMALDDLKASKDSMRLVRDSQGNWVYEFTEDIDAVEKAKNDLSQSMEDLYQMDKNQLEKTQDEMLAAQEEYYKEVQEIIKNNMAGKYATEEEFKAALEEATKKFNEKMVILNDEFEDTKLNKTTSTLGVILDAYKQNSLKSSNLTEEQKRAFGILAKSVGNDFGVMRDLVNGILTGEADDSIKNILNTLSEKTGLSAGEIETALKDCVTHAQSQWDSSIGDMISQMVGDKGKDGLQQKTEGAIGSIMSKWEAYKGKVGEVTELTGNDYESMQGKVDGLKDSTEALDGKTDELIDAFGKELEAITKATIAFEQHRGEVEKTIQKYIEFIRKLDELIRKQKQQANETPPPSNNNNSNNGNNGGGGGGGTPPSGGGGTGSMNYKDRVRVTRKNAQAWYTSTGTQVADWNEQARAVGKSWDSDFYVFNKVGNRVALSQSPGVMAMAWVDKNDVQGFDTGGYTGSWGSKEGRMAFLHEKEIVLNAKDTENILSAVNAVRGEKNSPLLHIAEALLNNSYKSLYAVGAIADAIISKSRVDSLTQSLSKPMENIIEQTVEIKADFSNVEKASEIRDAFDSLTNMASQYAHRRKGY